MCYVLFSIVATNPTHVRMGFCFFVYVLYGSFFSCRILAGCYLRHTLLRGVIMKNIAAVVFDFDGVIVDSIPWVHLAMHKTFEHYKLPALSLSEMCNKVRYPLDEWFLARGVGVSKEEAIHRYRTFAQEVTNNQTEKTALVPGVKQLIEALVERKVPRYIVSASQASIIEDLLAHHGLKAHFDGVYAGAYSKHTTLRDIAAMYGAHPNRIAFIDDWHPGVIDGVLAGCFTVGFAREGYTSSDVLLEAGAHVTVPSHDDLLRVLDGFETP